MTYVMEKVQKDGLEVIWCNARVERKRFYERFGMSETHKRFQRKGVSYVVMEKDLLEGIKK